MEINEGGKIARVRKGECVFIHKDNRARMTKQPKNKVYASLFDFSPAFKRQYGFPPAVMQE
ncbi:MAG: hypothetical protein LBU37_07290 [Tannerellaceae bacterium]|jgi:hypothetical protein|nr:hypothetical protein [Tannerellaceae bacterium]